MGVYTMKAKIMTLVLCIAAALCLWMWNLGRDEGIRYVIEESNFYIVDYSDTDAMENGYDTWVYIETEDGNLYQSGMYIC